MARPDRATFRLPAVALFVPVLLFVCITPLATADGAWWVLYIVPVLAFVWVLITHTTATVERMTTFGLLGRKMMRWDELDQLELPDARWAIAVGQDGRRLRLPMVRPRDVPRLVAVSGGSLQLGDQQGDEASADPTLVQDPADTAEPTAAAQERTVGGADPVGAVADPRPDAPEVAAASPSDGVDDAETGVDGVSLSRAYPQR